MKKTLIALAAVAATTGVFAQATISGVANFDMSQQENSPGQFAFGDFEVNFAASEDLGNGLTATARVGLLLENGRGTDGAKIGNATIAISSADLGTVTVGRVEAGNGITGRGYAGAPVIGADDRKLRVIIAGASDTNTIGYSSPRVSGFQVTAGYTQAVGKFGNNTANLVSSTAGDGGAYSFGANFSDGPISAGIDYQATLERVRMSASYDLGVAKVGAGYEMKGGAGDNYVLGVSAPLGAFTVGATYSANVKNRGVRSAGSVDQEIGVKDAAAFEVGAAYALSKRTSVEAAYVNLNKEAKAAIDGVGYGYRVRLSHSF